MSNFTVDVHTRFKRDNASCKSTYRLYITTQKPTLRCQTSTRDINPLTKTPEYNSDPVRVDLNNTQEKIGVKQMECGRRVLNHCN